MTPIRIPADPSWTSKEIIEGEEIELIDGGRVAKRDPEAELRALVEKIERRQLKTVEVAAEYWNAPPEELEKLPDRDKMTALSARLPKSEVPFGLQMAAHAYEAKKKQEVPKQGGGVNINIVTANLPPIKPRPEAKDVVVIDSKELRPVGE